MNNCKLKEVYFLTFLQIGDLTEQLFLCGKIHMNGVMHHMTRDTDTQVTGVY